jgi:hypothetical protein
MSRVGPLSVSSAYLHMKKVINSESYCGFWDLADFLVLQQIRALVSCAVLLSKRYDSVVRGSNHHNAGTVSPAVSAWRCILSRNVPSCIVEILTENVLLRGSGMGGNYAKVDVTILCKTTQILITLKL